MTALVLISLRKINKFFELFNSVQNIKKQICFTQLYNNC